jgi:hypothetical protein
VGPAAKVEDPALDLYLIIGAENVVKLRTEQGGNALGNLSVAD